MRPQNSLKILLLSVFILFFGGFLPCRSLGGGGSFALAQENIDNLKKDVSDKTTEIENLEKEIKKLDGLINENLGKANTLKNEIDTLDKTILQINTKIKLTEARIKTTEASIKKLEQDIKVKEENISGNKVSLGEMLRIVNEKDERNLVEIIFSKETVSEGFDEIESLQKLQKSVVGHVNDLEEAKTALEKNKSSLKKEQGNLNALRAQLLDQKKIANANKTAKNKLLADTKNEEVNYRKMLAETEAKKQAVELEMMDAEAKLKFAFDPSLIPKIGKILLAPLENTFITQVFGYTKEAKKLYASGFHNGVDLRASIGTTIRAMASGKIIGTGDTDTICRSASYGKWALVQHGNGLTTLYAHLSLVKVSEGQTMTIGDLIGYSGNTGYTTGPHLHLSVYASNGVKVDYLKSKVRGCGTYRLPLAPQNAYLNPQNYF